VIWLTNKQFGFLPGRSTMDAIIEVLDDWNFAKDQKRAIIAIFFDFAKAFDMVNHELLLEKLVALNLPGWLTSWIAAFLTDRKQRVVYNKTTTEWKNVEAGVIQGSVLGPILFILFLSDINKYFPDGVTFEKYADDILAYIIYDKSAGDLPQQIADGVQRWCADNQMRLNPSKCEVLAIPSPHSEPTIPIILNGAQLNFVTTYKYLGFNVNKELDCIQQWARVQKIIGPSIHLIKELKQLGFREEILITVYRAYVVSHFIYSAPMLSTASRLAKLEMTSFQNKMLRIINIQPDAALIKYNLLPITDQLDNTSLKILKRILADPRHPITINMPRNNSSTRGAKHFPYYIREGKTHAYNDSFMPTNMRSIRDRTSQLYNDNRRADNYNTVRLPQPTPLLITTKAAAVVKRLVPKEADCVPLVPCPTCGRGYKGTHGLRTHRRTCDKKQRGTGSRKSVAPK
jgi:hypothetical protein